MTTLNLPRLRTGNSVKVPAQNANWASPGGMGDLADALDVEAVGETKLHRIKSVPHAWGHVVMFETALLDDGHPAHADAKRQWRALLALLALRKHSTTSVDARPLALGVGGQGSGNRFLEVLSHESLKRKLPGEGPTWSPVHLLFAETPSRSEDDEVRAVLVGLLSPLTIVVPARDFVGDDELDYVWLRRGLADPLEHEDPLSPDQLRVCCEYVNHLKTAVNNQVGHASGSSRANELAKLLGAFAKQLEDREDRLKQDGISRFSKYEKQEAPLVDDADGIFKAVNSVWIEKLEDTVTDLELCRIRLEDSTMEVTVVLADRLCARTLGLRPEYVSLFNSTSLAELPEEDSPNRQEKLDSLRDDAARQGVLLLEPDDLLTERLVLLKEFSTRNHPSGFEDSLLPLKPAAVLVSGRLSESNKSGLAALKERLAVTETRRCREVQLKTMIKSRNRGDNPVSHPHFVRRRFESGQPGTVLDAYAPSALAAWPDFQAKRWKWNYLYTSTNLSALEEERSVVATSGISYDLLEEHLATAAEQPGTGTVVNRCHQLLSKWSSSAGPWGDRSGNMGTWGECLRTGKQKGDNPGMTLLQRSSKPFDGVLFWLPDSHGGGGYCGLGVLPEAAKKTVAQPEAENAVAEVAIDFGTSNTIVYSDRAPGPLRFTNRLRRFNQNSEVPQDYGRFMPGATVEQPFSTILQIRTGEGEETIKDVWMDHAQPSLWRDYAFFDPNVKRLTENLLSTRSGGLVFDLKWGTSVNERRRMGRYLHHIAMLSAAEVVGERQEAPNRLIWSFSYPFAFSEKDSDAYKSVIVGEAVRPLGWSEEDEVLFHTESDASCTYFLNLPDATTRALLVLDIGGGSTDIALASGDRGAWQQSIRLAGDDLMTEFLLENRSFVEELGIARSGPGGVFGDERSKDAFLKPRQDIRATKEDRNAARAIINSPQFADAFGRSWSVVEAGEEARRLKAGAWLMVGGLCSYIAAQIGTLDGSLDLKTIRVCFGGRGSTLFTLWKTEQGSSRGQVSEAARFEVLVKEKIAGGLGGELEKEHIELFFSEDPKHEAAKGMLAETKSRLHGGFAVKDGDLAIVGVGASAGEASVARTSSFREVRDTHRTRQGENEKWTVSWEQFEDSVTEVGKQCGFQWSITPVAKSAILEVGQRAFDELVRNDNVMEAPFIAMLREAMRLVFRGKRITLDWQN